LTATAATMREQNVTQKESFGFMSTKVSEEK
jgi:hypothetical protein